MNGTRVAMAATLIIGTLELQSVSPALGKAGPHDVIKTYLASGDPGTSLVLGKNVLSIIQIGCPRRYATCTLAMMAMDLVCEPSGDIPYAIQVTVDGKPVGDGEEVQPNGDCAGGTWVGNFSVHGGPHEIELDTVQNGQASGIQRQWSVNYAVTVP